MGKLHFVTEYPGWKNLIYRMMDELGDIDVKEFQVHFLTEHDGSLYVSHEGDNERGRELVSKYVAESQRTCTKCGRLGEVRKHFSRLACMCDQCAGKRYASNV